jgi:hypothetical protein
MTLKQFAKAHKIGIQYMSVAENPTMSDGGKGMNNYFVSLNVNGDYFNAMGLFFSMGKGIEHKPRAIDVLECLKSDILTDETSFREFCDNFGYDTDSRMAEETYKYIIEQTVKLKKWLGLELYEEFDGTDLDY